MKSRASIILSIGRIEWSINDKCFIFRLELFRNTLGKVVVKTSIKEIPWVIMKSTSFFDWGMPEAAICFSTTQLKFVGLENRLPYIL